MFPETSLLEILQEYGLIEENIEFEEVLKPLKVWLIHDLKTGRRLVLKRLDRSRTLLPILIHNQLHKQGLSVPKVYKTTTGEIAVQRKGRYYYLSDFIDGLKKINEKQRAKALAKFHELAQYPQFKDFGVPDKFPTKKMFLEQYLSKISDLTNWITLTQSPMLKGKIQEMIDIGLKTVSRLLNYDLDHYLQTMSKKNTICHGDYNMNNAYTTRNGDFLIIDFDFAYYGPPVEDFRFLSMSLIRNTPMDPLSVLPPLFKTYFKNCPQNRPFISLYRLDTMFPHEFHKQMEQLVNESHDDSISLDDHEGTLLRLARLEKNKYYFLVSGSGIK